MMMSAPTPARRCRFHSSTTRHSGSAVATPTATPIDDGTLAVAAGLSMMGIGFQPLAEVLTQQFKKKGDAVVSENVEVARSAYDYATRHFAPFERPLPMTGNRYAVLTGNIALAMGGAAARPR